MISEFCSLRLPKPRPGSSAMRFFSTPAMRARLAIASSSRTTVPATSGIGPSRLHVSGVPRMWFRISPASPAAATFATFGSNVRPLGSLTISTPYSKARSAISLLYVSIDRGIPSLLRRRLSTGTSRCHSSSAEIRFASGRVDSAPISMISAPSSSICNARA